MHEQNSARSSYVSNKYKGSTKLTEHTSAFVATKPIERTSECYLSKLDELLKQGKKKYPGKGV
jgi:hypothetical protein